jgi:hypothetical protein
MLLTKADLQDWNSHPVTKAVFKQVKEEIESARSESSMMDTVDQTALRTAFKEGLIEGAEALLMGYETVLAEAE